MKADCPEPSSSRGDELVISGTVVRDLASELTGKQHRLIIGLPDSFQSQPAARYPVLVLMDGQWDFPLVFSLAGGLRYDKVLPEMLIVGLSYAGEKPDYGSLRADDYVATRAKRADGSEAGGGAPRFLSWLETDVLPLLEREYRADPARRILAGTSHGGSFALYVLFEKPELFWGYVSISPSVGWDDRWIFRREAEFHAGRRSLDRRVWLSSGSQEDPGYLQNELAFFKQFSKRGYSGLALAVHSVEGERHAGVKPEAYNRALRFIAEPLIKP